MIRRGDIWLYQFESPDKRRPVVVMSRQDVIGLIRTVTVAPITSRIFGVPSEVIVGTEHGLKHRSAVNLDHLQTVDGKKLSQYVGHLDDSMMEAVCAALAIALGCA